jgi:heme-binding uptake protein ChaN (Tiki superfamily)
MATTGILRSRRSAAQLHALAGVEREIRANDPAGGRKYLRDYRDAYRSYEKVVTFGRVRDAIARAGVVLVGDYHALPNSQRYLASLIRDPELHRRPLVLGVETIFARDQHIVDEWFRGEIDEGELRQRIRFDLDWGYDWTPFYEFLSAAREHGAAIYGLDCMPREDLRKIGARDRHAADKIAEVRGRHPEAVVLALFGESHLAPQHLPFRVGERLPEERLLTVLQNVDALYWRAAGEATDRVEAVEVREDVFCVFNSTPLEKYENYRLCLDRWGRDNDGALDLGPTIYNLIDGLVRFLGINRYSAHNTTQPRLLVDLLPEVYSRKSNALLRGLLSRTGFTADQRRSMVRRVNEHGSAYLAPLNAVYVRKFQMMSAAEDAARFLHHACRGLPHRGKSRASGPLAADDAFYAAVLEHALGYFGSRVLYPARPAFRDADLQELYDVTREDLELQTALPYPDAVEAIDFLVLCRELECAGLGTPATPYQTLPLGFSGRKFEYVTEQLGCLLGNDLYDAYLAGRFTPAALRRLFLAHIEEPGAARETYLHLQTRLR